MEGKVKATGKNESEKGHHTLQLAYIWKMFGRIKVHMTTQVCDVDSTSYFITKLPVVSFLVWFWPFKF